ncbi:uncharacterized protein LOC124926793 isoform X3 [Impatiens glandulifera]|uniref:uncharacterized protein LOC124926793 isoform X3 n=1 Tax=Impatiens glandulifera TaxID=253017 RepID=UPI001FB04F67|nr:uncharacterized protein LOC124926793 isoform X3 [Impatiens glandulifera]
MLEAEVCSSRVFSPFRGEESGDEELAVLPRHTKVIVTGNNRTKSVLVGLHGVVKKAVGLGGWHWLVLKNGVEVKLQRNALSVLEPPHGNEEDEEEEDFDYSTSGSDLVQRHNNLTCGAEFTKLSKMTVRQQQQHHPKTWTAKLSSRGNCKELHSIIQTSQSQRVNLAKLGTSSLWRYWRIFKLGSINPSITKEQLVKSVQRHFASQRRMDEVQVITEFIRAAKRLKSKSSKKKDM